ncbi:D-alanyl-D-alanine carboxypeptidase [Neptunomonas antarctica]|uniref:D-alanyl-D-alanine carboxypeptidase n=2 Tax=Neptunomonas antarctica TaxID=619304 RepID=A0A1N7JFB6_9GAMM|nr:D-alanyl-D-alanine carboxypeptidase [Neptunomonas antarctica]
MLAALLFFVCMSSSVTASMPYIVVEAESGTVIKQSDADVPWYPASLTKMMTLYLTFQKLKNHDILLGSLLNVSDNAVRQPAVKLGVQSGEKISVEKAIKALSTVSSNDVAVVLAEAISGSEEKFAEKMNAQARIMSMKDSFFKNATGLPDAEQISSARDMAILARRLLLDFPEYYHYFSNRSLVHNGAVFVSHNGFLSAYPGADGFKTGYTCGSGYNLVASALHDGNRLIVVLFGAGSSGERKKTVKKLMDQGFEMDSDAPGLPLLSLRGSVPVHLGAPSIIQGAHCQSL